MVAFHLFIISKNSDGGIFSLDIPIWNTASDYPIKNTNPKVWAGSFNYTTDWEMDRGEDRFMLTLGLMFTLLDERFDSRKMTQVISLSFLPVIINCLVYIILL